MSRKPVIVFDVDGVCADYIGALLPSLRQITGRHVDYTDIHDYYYWRESCLNLGPEQQEELHQVISTRGFCAGLRPIPGAIAGIQDAQQYADVYVCTKPYDSEYWERERRVWVRTFLGVPDDCIMQGAAKHLLDANALVEDSADNLENWQQLGRPQYGILFNQPWNERAAWNGHRSHSWQDVTDFLRRRVA